MKIIVVLLLVAASAVAQSIESMGGRVGNKPSTLGQEIAARKAAEQKNVLKATGTNVIRLVGGKAYHVINSTNWVTLPGLYHRGKFSRPAAEGAVFELEKEMSRSWGTGINQGTSWQEFDREVIIKNYPVKKLIAGDPMPTLRVMPLTTTADGIAIYDYGTLPIPRPATNAPPVTAEKSPSVSPAKE